MKGNTNSSRDKKRPPLGKYWCFTFHDAEKYITLDRLDHILGGLGKFLHGHEICPETGRHHRQGYVQFNKRMRPSECKELPKQIHWEYCKGSAADNNVYVTKDWDDIRGDIKYDKPLRLITPGTEGFEWENDVLDIIKDDPDDRTIHWYYETAGNKGKSSFCRYLCAKHDALIIAGKPADAKYTIMKWKESKGYYPTLILYDIPRTQEGFVSYQLLEEVKNGCFLSTKYECGMVLMNHPHIFCFANFYPETEKMSEDRWKITEI